MGGVRDLREDDKEQEARIALLDYFGSLARHWATVLLATVVAFYSVWQIRQYVNCWVFTFALTMTVAGGAYAFLRMVTHGKYCEKALDPEVRPRGEATYVSRMLHGMLHSLRTDRWLKHLDTLGDFRGFLCWTLGSVCVWLSFTAAATLGFSVMHILREVIRWLLEPPRNALVLVSALVILGVLVIGFFTRIHPKTYERERETPVSDTST